MAVSAYAARRDLELKYWTDATTEDELRAAFRKRSLWIVSSRSTNALRYSTVLSNLSCRYEAAAQGSIETVRNRLARGLKKSAFDRLKVVLGRSGEDLSQVIRVPSRTLARRETFSPDESERILRVGSVFQRAIEVLGDLTNARRWFSTPARALGGKTPFDYCDTEPGAQEVMNLLGRIDHGVFS